MKSNFMLSVQKLSKDFAGTTAITNVSFEAQAGEIFGLLGPNGAGKTTTIRVIDTALAPTSGTAVVNGFDIVEAPAKVRAAIGVLTADFGLYDRMTGRENIRYAGQLYGLSGEKLERRIDELLTMLDMASFADRRAGKYSTGMKQKAAIARSVVHDPAVVIFDEPTSGLDVIAAQTVVAMMLRFRQQGKLVVLSTHDMHHAEQLCDRVAILHRGQVRDVGTVAEMKSKTNTTSLEAAFLALIGKEEAMAALKAEEAKSLVPTKKKSLWRRF